VFDEQKKATYGSRCCKMPKDCSPGLLKEIVNRCDVKSPHVQILGVKKLAHVLLRGRKLLPEDVKKTGTIRIT
jgi:hypothetical protein